MVVASEDSPRPAAPVFYTGIVKLVYSGDSVVVREQPRGGPPPERQISLSNVISPKLARRAGDKDEPYAWEAREFLRKRLVGKEVTYTIDYKVPTTGSEFGRVFVNVDGKVENIAELIVAEGLTEVRQPSGRGGDEYLHKLNDIQNAAKAAKKGKWLDDETQEQHVRNVVWTVENRQQMLETSRREPIEAVVEYVRDGSTMRVLLLPSFTYVTVMITGIRCPQLKVNDSDAESEPFADEAKFFTERCLLQQDVKVTLEGVPNYNFYGSILHPNGNIAETLLKEGLAKCIDWSMPFLTNGAERLRAAEKFAKEKRLRIWRNYQPPAPLDESKGARTFYAKVIEVVMGDALVVKKPDGTVQKIWLSSIRSPKSDDAAQVRDNPVSGRQFRPLYDIPYMFEAREFLRKKLVGKKVMVTIDYIQQANNNFPERVCCTVVIGGQNVAEALIGKGLAGIVRYRETDENRSSQYDQLLAAEAKAEKSKRGIHSLSSKGVSGGGDDVAGSSKPKPSIRVQEFQGNHNKSKQFLPFLKMAGVCEGIVEFVASGSRFRIYIPKETCLITFLLSGINCPRSTRNISSGSSEGEPFGNEALQFSKDLCLQRDVEVEVETVDKVGNFVGWMLVDGKNLAELLVQNGLATVHFTAERSKYYNTLSAAETKAKEAKLNIWSLPPSRLAGSAEETDELEYTPSEEKDRTIERVVQYRSVIVTEVMDDLKFYVQFCDQGQKLEQTMNELRSELKNYTFLPGSYVPRKGDLCCALFSADQQWYRARIESINSKDRILVFYVDFGNSEWKTVSDLAPLPSAYVNIPFGAHLYALALMTPPEDSDDLAAAKAKFVNDVYSCDSLLLNTEYRAAGIAFATLMRPDHSDIGKDLISEGYCLVGRKNDPRLKALGQSYVEAEEHARKTRKNIWKYGDFTGVEL